MTPERQNEIWAMLTQEEKAKYSKEYLSPTEDDWDKGYEAALCSIFGKHNLTAQAEEKLEEPRFKENDVLYVVNPKHPLYNQRVRLDRWIADGKFWLVIDRSCGLREIKESDLALYTEPKEDGKISDKKGLLDRVIDAGYNFLDRHNPDVIPERGISNIDYTRYRLDLAKEIAKVMFGDASTFHHSEVPEFAVNAANEIVKRLKETEE